MTALTAATRYFLPGTTKVLVTPAVTSLPVGPTRAQITASTDVSGHIAAINGWNVASAFVPTPDLGGRFVKQVTGRLNADNSSIDFWASKDGVDIRDLLTLDQATFITFMDGGDTEDYFMDCFKVVVASVGKMRDVEGAGRISISFSISDYVQDAEIPAVV